MTQLKIVAQAIVALLSHARRKPVNLSTWTRVPVD
jgi:hypothetical protein